MTELYEALRQLVVYRGALKALILLIILAMMVILVANALRNLRRQMDAAHQEKIRDDNLRNIDYDTLGRKEKSTVIRNIVTPDAIDPGPNKYMVISDGGKDIYVRSFTIKALPNRVRFANTFSDLMNFKNCMSSIFIAPIAEDVMLNKFNNHIKILDGEKSDAIEKGNSNRSRNLSGQLNDANRYAGQIEAGNTKFFSVGFLFSIHANSIKELNTATDQFRAISLKHNIKISNCYAVQAEAYAMNGPWNKQVKVRTGKVPFDGVHYFYMDKRSISTIYNYTQMSFSHKSGVILGLDMFTAAPVIYDTFDPSDRVMRCAWRIE